MTAGTVEVAEENQIIHCGNIDVGDEVGQSSKKVFSDRWGGQYMFAMMRECTDILIMTSWTSNEVDVHALSAMEWMSMSSQ